jgi:hypothetical protein
MSWNINTNFTNVRAMGSGSTAPEEGAYIVTIAKTEAMDSKKQAGLVNVKVFASVNDDGYEVSDIFPLPNGMDEKKDRSPRAPASSVTLSRMTSAIGMSGGGKMGTIARVSSTTQ